MKKISISILSVALLACSNTTSESKNSTETEQSSVITTSNQVEITANEIVNSEDDKSLSLKEKVKNIKNTRIPKQISKADSVSEITIVNNENLTEPEAQELPKADFSKVYGQILTTYVSASGKVNYSGLKKNSSLVDQAIIHFQENAPKSSWSANQKLAYWINAYNLFTVKLIIDNYPVSSIKNIAGGKPWDKKFIELDGKTLSLNDIENGIIRKQFNEPRIHFAVNCASISCPKLLNQEYTASNLNTLLEKQAKRYINDKNENSFTTKTADISSIFDWYKGDFDGGVIPFLNKYLDTPISENAKITYKDYNWNLNN